MIEIFIDDSEKLDGEKSLFIIAPPSSPLAGIIRDFKPRHWHAKYKEWELPIIALDKLKSRLKGLNYIIDGDVPKIKPTKIIGFEFKTKPFPHQVEAFNYGMTKKAFLLGDDMGLGKTKTVIDIAVAKRELHYYQHCLIICGVNSLKWNWIREIETHSHETGHVLGHRLTRKGTPKVPSTASKLEDLTSLPEDYFLVTNIETLRDAGIRQQIETLCKNGIIGMIAVDEVHKCKNPSASQSRALLRLNPETKIAMSGTPLMNTPIDLFMPLKWLGHEDKSFTIFKSFYTRQDAFGAQTGYKNLDILRAKVKNVMLRRLKEDVLDLPPKLRHIEYVEMNTKQTKIYNDVLDLIKKDIDKIRLLPNPLSELIRLRQSTAHTSILSSTISEGAKIDRLEELVEDIAESGKKCIVFSNWTKVTDIAFSRLSRFNPALVTGDNAKDREAEQVKFKTDKSCSVIVGTISAMGTGLTLTEASTVIFLDSPWNMANKEQAEDRAHRIGTKGTVNIITIVCKHTIDEKIEHILTSKGDMAKKLVDGEISKPDARQLFDTLMEDL